MFELIFITSNNEKLAHARHLCSGFQMKISKQKNYGVGYSEPRIQDRDSLLKRSIEDAIVRFSKSVANHEEKFFFIEDTSVIIQSLSSEGKEVPGVDIKYWMNENDFSSVNSQLIEKGNNRDVTVRSDIILVVPKKLQEHLKLENRYLIFNSYTKGYFTKKEFEIETQPLYPWLNNRTFNKWFVPENYNKPISTLDIQDADSNDFRRGAFEKMLIFLETNQYIKTKKKPIYEDEGKQISLFQPWLYIICGPTCAGKTTLARYLTEKHNYYHIEASDFMYLNYHERHGVDSNVKIGDFASEVLSKNPGIVVNRILRHIKNIGNIPIVITGFRNYEEVNIFEKNYIGDLTIEPIFINAKIEIRYAREKLRAREDSVLSYEDFLQKNIQQEKMGLSEIGNQLKDTTITNESSLNSYYEHFQKKYDKPLNNTRKIIEGFYKKNWSTKRLENAILAALLEKKKADSYFTTTEISHLINALPQYTKRPKSKNNVSRYFNQDFHPYYEIAVLEDKTTYRLSNTGYSRGILLQK